MKSSLLIVDSHAIIHRAYHALPILMSKEGLQTHAIYGFFAMLHKVVNDFKITNLVTCFDTPKPSFRKEILSTYQAKRPKMDNELAIQIPIIKEILDSYSILRLEKEGFEGDDVIGTLCKNFSKYDDIVIYVLTGDRDILQLVNDKTFVISPKIGVSTIKLFDFDAVVKQYQIKPNQIPDMKALSGDSSDNYHAIKGLGPKTAISILDQFGNIENLYNNINDYKNDRFRNLLLEYKDDVFLCKTIATIKQDLDLKVQTEDCIYKEPKDDFFKALEKYQLFSLIKRFKGNYEEKEKEKKIEKKKDPDDGEQMSLF